MVLVTFLEPDDQGSQKSQDAKFWRDPNVHACFDSIVKAFSAGRDSAFRDFCRQQPASTSAQPTSAQPSSAQHNFAQPSSPGNFFSL